MYVGLNKQGNCVRQRRHCNQSKLIDVGTCPGHQFSVLFGSVLLLLLIFYHENSIELTKHKRRTRLSDMPA